MTTTVATATSLFARFRERTDALHERTVAHRTVQGIGAGNLPEETFRFYIEQDFQYLLRFVKVLSIAASSSPNLEMMSRLGGMATSIIDIEIDGLRALYARFGGDPAKLDEVEPAPACTAYFNHLLASVYERDLLVSLAAILPCLWGYHDIGLRLKEQGLPEDERFAAWIEEYASEAYGEVVDRAIKAFNELGEGASERQIEAAFRAWDLSSRYEYGFWEMAWNRETWPAEMLND